MTKPQWLALSICTVFEEASAEKVPLINSYLSVQNCGHVCVYRVHLLKRFIIHGQVDWYLVIWWFAMLSIEKKVFFVNYVLRKLWSISQRIILMQNKQVLAE